MTGDDKELIYNYTHYRRFLKDLRQFHRLPNTCFTSESSMTYIGDAISIELRGNRNVQIIRHPDFERIRHNTKLSFIPSERNLVSAIKNVDRTYRANEIDVLFNHIFEWDEVKAYYSEENPISLSIVGDMEYSYNQQRNTETILLKHQREKISPFYASSGVQSVLPIIAMTKYFTGPVFTEKADLSKSDVMRLFRKFVDTENLQNDSLERVSKLYNYQSTKLFIEEPEQNLFPESQQALINFIANRINMASYGRLPSSVTITTHSPYIITAFNVLLKAAVAQQINAEKTSEIIPESAIIPANDLRAYYVTEEGTLSNIVDSELGMISGMDLDHASDIVEDKLSLLNDIIYGE